MRAAVAAAAGPALERLAREAARLPAESLTAQGAGLLASALARAEVEGPAGAWGALSRAVCGLDAGRLDWFSAANLVDAFRPRWPKAAVTAAGEVQGYGAVAVADRGGSVGGGAALGTRDATSVPETVAEGGGTEADGRRGLCREGGAEVLDWVGQAILGGGRTGLSWGAEGGEGAGTGVEAAVLRVVCGMAAAGRLADDALYGALRKEVRWLAYDLF